MILFDISPTRNQIRLLIDTCLLSFDMGNINTSLS